MRKIKNALLLMALLLFAVIVLTGCSSKDEVQTTVGDQSASNSEQAPVEEEVINVDGVLSKDKKFMVGTVENKLEEDYDVKQYAEDKYVVNAYVSKGTDEGMYGKVSMVSESSIEEAKNAILKESAYVGARVSERTIKEYPITILNSETKDDAYTYVQALLFEKEGTIYRIDYTINEGQSADVGELLLQEIVLNTKLYTK